MATLFQRARRRLTGGSERSDMSFDDYVQLLQFGGLPYGGGLVQTQTGTEERIEANFPGMVSGAYKKNGIIFACILTRMLVFSEARFQFQRLVNGRPGELFGTRDLALLERPWPGATTGDMLARMEQDASLAGSNLLTVRGGRVRRMRPDWTVIVLGSETDENVTGEDLDADLLGYMYMPGGAAAKRPAVFLLPEEVSHYAPIPDPAASYRGMSWLTPVIEELQSDGAATRHKKRYFEHAATPNMIVRMDPSINKDMFEKFKAVMESEHAGADNAYRTLYLGGAADAKVVGSNLRELDFRLTQGAGETRIAAAAGVPPVIVGLSEGLAASTYSNYTQARRRFADGTLSPLWRSAAGSLANLVRVPEGSRLWFDNRDIPFLQEDREDAAEIQAKQAQTIRQLVDAGYVPDSVVQAVEAEDFTLLRHSGLYSVQLQPPGSSAPQPDPA